MTRNRRSTGPRSRGGGHHPRRRGDRVRAERTPEIGLRRAEQGYEEHHPQRWAGRAASSGSSGPSSMADCGRLIVLDSLLSPPHITILVVQ